MGQNCSTDAGNRNDRFGRNRAPGSPPSTARPCGRFYMLRWRLRPCSLSKTHNAPFRKIPGSPCAILARAVKQSRRRAAIRPCHTGLRRGGENLRRRVITRRASAQDVGRGIGAARRCGSAIGGCVSRSSQSPRHVRGRRETRPGWSCGYAGRFAAGYQRPQPRRELRETWRRRGRQGGTGSPVMKKPSGGEGLLHTAEAAEFSVWQQHPLRNRLILQARSCHRRRVPAALLSEGLSQTFGEG
jgi:hypothetical protein